VVLNKVERWAKKRDKENQTAKCKNDEIASAYKTGLAMTFLMDSAPLLGKGQVQFAGSRFRGDSDKGNHR
jgi:hypothetical protein